MNIPEELRERVSITDHGVVDMSNPERYGETIRSYVTSFAVEANGVEYLLTLASSPLPRESEEVYAALLEMGIRGVLVKAGLLP